MAETAETLSARIAAALARIEAARARDVARVRDLEELVAASVADLDALLSEAR
ncbi:hypothetical protein [Glacieibacterium frigidum]|uniref:hypothetical protein n=1 Tax=Glacieibacterium frigidum TaxID=2593303 RepID=UPI00163DBB58|nr:hypothetical protein [Glacieibacterium frigidum]